LTPFLCTPAVGDPSSEEEEEEAEAKDGLCPPLPPLVLLLGFLGGPFNDFEDDATGDPTFLGDSLFDGEDGVFRWRRARTGDVFCCLLLLGDGDEFCCFWFCCCFSFFFCFSLSLCLSLSFPFSFSFLSF
jgi:hypothetical protein